MAQHDNASRHVGQQSGAWQPGRRDSQDHSNGQQDQSSGGRDGSLAGGDRQRGQQGGHDDQRGARGHQDQFDAHRGQQGDDWRERQGAGSGGWHASRGGQGSFGGQASDNDYGNRGITESGNFGNYGAQRDSGHDVVANHQNRPGQGGNDLDRGRGRSDTRSSADDYRGVRGGQGQPDNQDRYGDNGYQGNFQQGQRGQAYHDADYRQWRSEQVARLDRDYDEWRQHRYQRFSQDFDHWRANRDNNPAARGSSQVGANATPTSVNGEQGPASDVSGQQGGASRQDASNGGDKGADNTATQ